jgi:hypothetical protein
MSVGSVSETVEITSGVAETVNTTSSSITTVTKTDIAILPINERSATGFALTIVTKSSEPKDSDETSSQKSTPKLREYFPETLVWQPELITNTDGKAELKFKMADNITTWKIYAIASTKNG